MHTHTTTLARRALVAAAASLLVACGGDEDTAKLQASADSLLVPPPAPAPAPLTDASIVAILDQANVNDSAGGAMAVSKGTSKDVKDFGRQMMRDHSTLRKQGQDLAAKLGVSPQPPAVDSLDLMAKGSMDHMSSMPTGAEWDKMYISGEIAMHEAVLKTATAAQAAAQSQELKDLIAKAAPVIQGHLDKAKALNDKLNAPAAGTKSP